MAITRNKPKKPTIDVLTSANIVASKDITIEHMASILSSFSSEEREVKTYMISVELMRHIPPKTIFLFCPSTLTPRPLILMSIQTAEDMTNEVRLILAMT